MSENSNGFNSFFGFLMASVGSAIGFGNVWGFPYKMGTHGGFAFLICYLVLCVFVGFIVLFGEFFIGRSTGSGAIGAYRSIGKRYNKKLGFMGWMAMLSAILLSGFYCTLGGYTLKYCFANLGALFGAGWGFSGDPTQYFANYMTQSGEGTVWTLIFVLLTAIICIGGVSSGIEKFCSVGMPVLFFLLIVIIIRSGTLPGSGAGFAFIFKPDWSALAGKQIITTFSSAGGQMFFSLSLGFGAMLTYGAYLKKDANLQSSAILVLVFDTLAAVMAAMAVFPAVFAFGLEPASGPGLLFMTMQHVFVYMGTFGYLFGLIFYLLVAIAGISSSIALLESITVSFQELSGKGSKEPMSRNKAVWISVIIMAVLNLIVTVDGLGMSGHLSLVMGKFVWLDFFDLFAEGLMMPVGALIMTLIIGYIIGKDDVLAEAEMEGQKFPAINFFMGCAKTIAPLGMLFILLGQIDTFFGLGWFS